MSVDYLVQESDGTSKFTLEDSSGSILLESSTASGGGSASTTALASTAIQILVVNDVL